MEENKKWSFSDSLTLNTIVADVMKTVSQIGYLHSIKPDLADSCDGDIECLLFKHTDRHGQWGHAYSLAMTFNSYADYEGVIKNLRRHIFNLGGAVEGHIQDYEDSLDSKDAIPVSALTALGRQLAIARRSLELERIATAYACLSVQWEKTKIFYEEKDMVTADIISQAFSVMRKKGVYDEWLRLAREKAPSDKRLEIMERGFHA